MTSEEPPAGHCALVTVIIWYLNPGATGTYTCTSTAPAPGSYTYSAIPTAKGTTGTAADSPSGYGWWNGGTGINYNSGTGQVTATETLVVEEPAVADLAVAKTVSPNTTVAAGEDVTYTITVSNEGADSTSTYTLTDTIPSSFTDIRVTSPATGCTVDQTTRVITCANQAVPSGTATNTYTILAKATTAGATSNTATVSKLPEETVTDNNTSAPATVRVQQADLTVTKTASKPTYLTGEKATWTVTVTNTNAPNSTTSSTYTLEDIVPAQFTNVAVTGGSPTCAAVTNNTVNCANQAGLAPGASRTYTITADATTATTAYTNTAKITNTSFERSTTNNEASATGQIQATEADLAVTKTATPTQAVTGQTVTFDIEVANVGNALSSTYTLADVVPSQFTDVNFSGTPPGGCTISGNTVTCTDQAALAPSATRAYTITAVATNPGAYTNEASVTADDLNQDNNTSSVAGSVDTAQSDLAITKSATPTMNVVNGTVVTYTVEVTNHGNIPSSSYTLTDPVPAAFTDVTVASVSPATAECTVANNTVTCLNQESLAPNTKRTYTITAVANEYVAGRHTNTATVSDTTGEPTDNNSASVDVTLVESASVLEINKTVDRTALSPGERVTFTITVTNTGDARSSTYTVNDPLPEAFVGAESPTPGCTWFDNTVTCADQPALDPGESKDFIVTAWVAADANQGITANEATITTPGQDPATGEAGVEVGVPGSGFDLAVTKTVEPQTAPVYSEVTFTITVTNVGNAISSEYTVFDTVPAPFESARIDAVGCYVHDKSLACSDQAPLLPGASRTYTLIAQAGPDAIPYTNTVEVGSLNEANLDNNTASVSGVTVSTDQQYWPGNSGDGAESVGDNTEQLRADLAEARAVPAAPGTAAWRWATGL